MITRRSVLLAIGVLVAPRLSQGQPQSKTPRIGFLWFASIGDPSLLQFRSAFQQRLSALGYVDGKDILIEERFAEGHAERLSELARDLAASKVDVIVATAVAASSAARQATSTIPIVMVHAGDPVGAGLIASLARPGGNVTGTTNLSLGGKQVELMRELVPRAVKLGVLVNPSNAGTRSYVVDVMETGRRFNLIIAVVEVTRVEDFSNAFAMIRNMRPDGLVVMAEPLIGGQPGRSDRLCGKRPTTFNLRYREYGQGRRFGLLWPAFCRTLCHGRRVRRQDSQGRKASRPAGRTANEIRARHQFEDSEGAWPDHPSVAHRAGGRGDSMIERSGMSRS